jgi:hypothetical protein
MNADVSTPTTSGPSGGMPVTGSDSIALGFGAGLAVIVGALALAVAGWRRR